MGVIPSSISVPRLLAIIIRSQYSGSEVSASCQSCLRLLHLRAALT